MSTRRLIATTAAMALVAVGLHLGTPDLSWLSATGGDLQRAVDTAGPETLVLSGVAVLAWAVWAWGLLGLVLTALSVLPGVTGSVARAVARRLLPAGTRQAAALALGVGLVAGGPLVAGYSSPSAPAAAAVPAAAKAQVEHPAEVGPVADWPVAPAPEAPSPPTSQPPAFPSPAPPVPDWPSPAPGDHVVLRGECLWDIAAADLRMRSGREPTDAEVVPAVQAWWQANASVIGPDPDLLLPGQVLRPPVAP